MEKKYKVHIVPKNQVGFREGDICRCIKEGHYEEHEIVGTMCIAKHSSEDPNEYWQAEDIIITDPEAEIVGDSRIYLYGTNNTTNNYSIKSLHKDKCELVIASTNPEHNLPQLTTQDIQYIIDSGVEEVELEMDTIETLPVQYELSITDNCIKIVIDYGLSDKDIQAILDEPSLGLHEELYLDSLIKKDPLEAIKIALKSYEEIEENNKTKLSLKPDTMSKINYQVVMLPTDSKSKLLKVLTSSMQYRGRNKGDIEIHDSPWKTNDDFEAQHLYITSDEKIFPSDKCMFTFKDDGSSKVLNVMSDLWAENNTCNDKQIIPSVANDKHHMYYCRKIVASTDPSLGLPPISETFIEKYAMNNGRLIHVRLGMEWRVITNNAVITALDKQQESIDSHTKFKESIKPEDDKKWTDKDMIEFAHACGHNGYDPIVLMLTKYNPNYEHNKL